MTISFGLRSPTREKKTAWRGRGHSLQGSYFALGIALLAIGNGVAAPAEQPAAPETTAVIRPVNPSAAYGDDEFLIPEVFQSHLPTTLEKYALRVWLNPHVGDYLNKDHMRLTTGIRYGLSANWEMSMNSDLYFSHGNGAVRAFEEYGAANIQLGTKINLGQPLRAGWDIGTGFDYITPTGRPPAELTDGLRHFMPYLTFSHRCETRPNLRIFWGLRLDEVTHTSLPGELGKNAFGESSSGITGGWVIDRQNWHYTFEAAYDTTRLMGRSSADVFTIRPGVMWEIPSRRSLRVKGHWVVGIAVQSAFGPGGTSVGASLRLRYSRDLKIPFRRTASFSAP